LLGSGTISGAVRKTLTLPSGQVSELTWLSARGELGCLFEATPDEGKPMQFIDGTILAYLEDHDEVVLGAWCCDARVGSYLVNVGEYFFQLVSERTEIL
jgi:hypothetical protein